MSEIEENQLESKSDDNSSNVVRNVVVRHQFHPKGHLAPIDEHSTDQQLIDQIMSVPMHGQDDDDEDDVADRFEAEPT